jgi:hypothetical protein
VTSVAVLRLRHGIRFAAMSRMLPIRKIILVLFIAANSEAAGVSVLFVGNSLTEKNDLPNTFKQLAAESSLHANVEVHSITLGGAFLYDHWKRGDVAAELRKLRPNFLVLQGQSTEPVSAPQSFAHSAALLKAEADHVGAVTILFSTWARPAGDPYYKDPSSGGSPVQMQIRLNAAYAQASHRIGATLAPVGVAFEHSQHDAPQIQLLDGTQHPSAAGTYLAAAVLFRAIFNASPIGSTYYEGLPKETATRLQRIAETAPSSVTR